MICCECHYTYIGFQKFYRDNIHNTNLVALVSSLSGGSKFLSSNLSAISWRKQVTFPCVNDIHFVLDQHVQFDFYSASSLTQQSVRRYVFPPLLLLLLLPVQGPDSLLNVCGSAKTLRIPGSRERFLAYLQVK